MTTQTIKRLILISITGALLINQAQSMAMGPSLARAGTKTVRTGIGLTIGGFGALIGYNRLKHASQPVQHINITMPPIEIPKKTWMAQMPSLKTVLVVGGIGATALITWRLYQALFGDRFRKIEEKITEVDGHVTKVGEQVAEVDGHVTEVGTQVTQVSGQVAEVDRKVANTQLELKQLHEKQQAILLDLKELSQQLALYHAEDQAAYQETCTRLEQLKENLAQVHGDIERLTSNLTREMKTLSDRQITNHDQARLDYQELAKQQAELAETSRRTDENTQEMLKLMRGNASRSQEHRPELKALAQGNGSSSASML